MASSKIKGITIEIDGNTTKLSEALKNVNKVIYSTNSELKNLNTALKLDPKNTELLAQKHDVLKKNIEATKEKLEQLKEAQRQMGDYNSLTEEQKENYRALSVEIAKSENALKSMNSELNNSSKIDLTKLKYGLKKVGEVALDVAKKMAQVAGAIGTALGAVVTAGVKSYASLEQNLGGVETLFKDSADKVIANAKKAYATAGVSANEYMEGVTSFSASLLQSLGNNTAKAADVADMAFRDMSDNANKFGTDMASIQNAYQGFAKQNYTMLDNLKLGYGGTKTEMERLLKDAQKISGIKYDIKNLSDVYNAIHVIQNELKVSGLSYEEAMKKVKNGEMTLEEATEAMGTTAKEATTTISGSIASMKAAFDNFINGSGGVTELAETIKNVIHNIANAVTQIAPDILTGLVQLIQELLPQITTLIFSMLPTLIQNATELIQNVLDMIKANVQPIADTVVSIIMTFVNFILDNLPTIIEVGLQIIVALALGIAKQLPELIPTLVDTILYIVDILVDNVDLLVEASIQIIIALAEGLINALPRLLEKVPIIIEKLVKKIIELAPKLLSAALQLIVTLAKGLIENLPKVVEVVPNIISGIVNALKEGVSKVWDVGKNMMEGLWNGIKEKWEGLKNAVKSFGEGIVNKFKDVFGIHSPSRVMRLQIGHNLGEGVIEGIDDTIGDIEDTMKGLNYKVQTSINPIINPNAISEQMNNFKDINIPQPVLQIDYNQLASCLAKEISKQKIVLDEEVVGKFVEDTVTEKIYT